MGLLLDEAEITGDDVGIQEFRRSAFELLGANNALDSCDDFRKLRPVLAPVDPRLVHNAEKDAQPVCGHGAHLRLGLVLDVALVGVDVIFKQRVVFDPLKILDAILPQALWVGILWRTAPAWGRLPEAGGRVRFLLAPTKCHQPLTFPITHRPAALTGPS